MSDIIIISIAIGLLVFCLLYAIWHLFQYHAWIQPQNITIEHALRKMYAFELAARRMAITANSAADALNAFGDIISRIESDDKTNDQS